MAVANGCSLSQPLHITDQLEMLSLMGHNVLLNNAQGRVKPSVLNWCVKTCSRLLATPFRNIVDPKSYPSFLSKAGRYPRPHAHCLSATLVTCSVTSFLPYRVSSTSTVANHDQQKSTGASHCRRKQ